MKKIILYFLPGLLALSGCKNEQDVQPANEKTFFHYYGSEYSNQAIMVTEVEDGYTMLGLVEIISGQSVKYRAKLIHTDVFGNIIWQNTYPNFVSDDHLPIDDSFKPSSFISAADGGYIIIGERIKDQDGATDLYLVKTNPAGETELGKNLDVKQGTVHGRAVAEKKSGNLIVLGSVTGNLPNDMFLAELNINYDTLWTRQYGSGTGAISSTVTNRLFLRNDSIITWSGSFKSHFRFLVAKENRESTESDVLLDNKSSVQTASDFIPFLDGYAYIGSTNENGTEDIFMTRVTQTGAPLVSSDPIPFDNDVPGSDVGNSISPAIETETGLICLGTVESTETRGNGKTDFYLAKMAPDGSIEWFHNYGGKDKEEGASVIATKDKSYLLFGTTYFGSLKKLMLMKVNSKGQL
jgi:hypothetical protein